MTLVKNVVKVYFAETKSTINVDEKRTDHKNGSFKTERTTKEKIVGKFFAMLDCGHIREPHSNEDFRDKKKLSCWKCDNLKRKKEHPEIEWLQDAEIHSELNFQMVNTHKSLGFL